MGRAVEAIVEALELDPRVWYAQVDDSEVLVHLAEGYMYRDGNGPEDWLTTILVNRVSDFRERMRDVFQVTVTEVSPNKFEYQIKD